MLRGTAATRCGTGGERPSSAATSNAPASVSCLVSCLSQVPGATLWRRRGARATARWAHPPGCCRPRNWPRECRLTSAVRTKTPSLFPKRCPENALGRLGREPRHREVTAVLAQYAPTWLAQLPALANLSEREGLQRILMGATRERMLRELTDALEVLAIRQPIVIVLEDLHWSDHSTAEFIAYLAQRRGPARLLLIGTYRPADLQARAHPLKGVVQELQARGRCEELRLKTLRETEIDTYVGKRFGEGTFPATLAELIHQRTGGNPLFMVNMIEHFL